MRPGTPSRGPAARRAFRAALSRPEAAPDQPAWIAGPVDPDAALWEALRLAGPRGITPKQLAQASGRGRTWVHERLREHAASGRVVQVRYGRWRAAEPPGAAAA